MEFLILSLLNGLSYGLLLFLLSSGLTLTFSMMGVLNFAHASFYMLGAYLGYTVSGALGFWPALLLAPLGVGVLGALFERFCLRRVHRFGHVPELLVTFGLSYIIVEMVQLVWGRVALEFHPPALLRGPAFTLIHHASDGLRAVWGAAPTGLCTASADVGAKVMCSPFPATRGFMMVVALFTLGAVWLLLTRSRIGLVIQAALTHPAMAEALGHNVPRVFMGVFGAGSALAGLAGVMGGSTFLTEPTMASSVGSVIFVVVVVGGMGSLAGAFWASLLIGTVQTLAVSLDSSLTTLAQQLGLPAASAFFGSGLAKLSLAQLAPVLPYLLLLLVLVFRPGGLLGAREA
jgi:branched-chain amino acid transport system permease protein